MRTLAATVRGGDPPSAVERAERILDAGFDRVVLEGPLWLPSWEALRRDLPHGAIAAIGLFLPWPRRIRVGQHAAYGLGGLDADERRAAVQQAEAGLRAADGARVPRVLVPPVEVREPASTRPPGAERRRELDGLRAVLDPLLVLAERFELCIALTPTDRAHELPDLGELEALGREFSGAPLGTWFDAPRCGGLLGGGPQRGRPEAGEPEPVREAGDEPPSPEGPPEEERPAGPEAFPESLPAVQGIAVRDAREGREGLLPGRGDVDWARIDPFVRAAPFWCLDLDPAEDADLGRCREFLERLQAGPAEPGGLLAP